MNLPHFIFSAKDRYWTENGRFCGPSYDWLAATLAGLDIDLARCTWEVMGKPVTGRPNIVFGTAAARQFMLVDSLEAHRGFVHSDGVTSSVCTFAPIDCVDYVDREGSEDVEEEFDDRQTFKDTCPTRRRNFGFWAARDIAKCINPPSWVQFTAHQTHLRLVTPPDVTELATIRGSTIYVDIETHPDTNTLQCFSYAIDDQPVKSAVIYNHQGRLDDLAVPLLAAFSLANAHNRVVYHNGAGFDLVFMAVMYRMPFGRDIYDTMVTHHRLFPEAEKSLAHCITLYCNRPYHKSTSGTFHPRSWSQLMQLLTYNAVDVETTREVYLAQQAYINSRPRGWADSVEVANTSIYPYLVAGLFGMGVDFAHRGVLRRELERRVTQLQRVLDILVGYNINAGSNTQLATYFHKELNLPVVSQTETGAPSLAGNALYLLLQRHPGNVVPRIIIELRAIEKQLQQLNFMPLPL